MPPGQYVTLTIGDTGCGMDAADEIVMGTRGLGGLAGLLLGSVATEVIREAKVPVTLVADVSGNSAPAAEGAFGELRGEKG